MDPIHLLPEELDYELDIRGVYNLSTSRQKTTCLREFLKREEGGERTISDSRLEKLSSKIELARCALILENIAAAMQAEGFDAASRIDCQSRLLHVIQRVKRSKPSSPEEQTIVYELLMTAEEQLSYFQEVVSLVRDPPLASKSASPLADAIESISRSRLSNSARNSQSEHDLREVRKSLLNPSVMDFIPIESASGGVANLFQNPFKDKKSHPPVNRNELASNDIFGPSHSHIRSEIPRPRFQPERLDNDLGENDSYRVRPFGPSYRKSVPVHQWKLSFSGEPNTMHLYDFLSELRMFQRSERVPDEVLLASVVHLLSGRARLWYRSWFATFECWDDLVAAMKTEFLPPKYDYKLLTTISNRRQKPNETFSEYLNAMQSQFQHLSIPVDEQHKLSIIEENMLTKYVVATSAVEITRLDQLSNICRRVDYAYAKTPQFSAPPNRITDSRPVFRNNQQGRYRDVQELEIASQQTQFPQISNPGSDESNRELLEMRRDRQSADSNRNYCYNCLQVGHNFSNCPAPRSGQFCYRCGLRDVTTFTCKNCPKNGDTIPGSRDSGQDPRSH